MAYVCILVIIFTPCVSLEGEQERDVIIGENNKVSVISPHSVVAAVSKNLRQKE